MIKKADIILFFLILAFGLAVSWWSLAGNAAGDGVIPGLELPLAADGGFRRSAQPAAHPLHFLP